MSDELLRVLNAPVDDESALARMWEEYAMSGVDESSDSRLRLSDTQYTVTDSEVATQVGNLVQMAFSLTTSLTCWQVTDTLILNRRCFYWSA